MKLAVFTSQYPAKATTFFERDVGSLLDAGVDLDIFAIHPVNETLWSFASLLDHPRMSRARVFHLGVGESLTRAGPILRRQGARCLRDLVRPLVSSLRFGLGPTAKTGYVFPKAWAWAAEHAGRYDHVLAYWGNYAGTCAYAFHRLDGRSIPFSLWLHAGVDLYKTPIFLRQKLRYADTVLTCCEFNRDYILNRFSASVPGLAERLHVCHHGLDLGGFTYQPEGRVGNRIAAVGRLAGHKGFDYLLRAARQLLDRGVAVAVELVGDGPERGALERLAAELGLGHRVRFTGWLPFTEARAMMSRATVLVHPSDGLGDGLPNVIREAMAVGTPVVASAVAGIPDALEGGCGTLVPARDPTALAGAIAALLADPVARLGIAARARRRVEERYDVRRTGPELARLLTDTRRRVEEPPATEPLTRSERQSSPDRLPGAVKAS